jgi:hypothetical protein
MTRRVLGEASRTAAWGTLCWQAEKTLDLPLTDACWCKCRRENGLEAYRSYSQVKSVITRFDKEKFDWFVDDTVRYG